MKNKKTMLGIIVVLSILIGFCNITNVFGGLENPDYTETIPGGHAFKIFWSLNEGDCVEMEYLITGGNADLHLYIRNSTGDVIKDFGTIYDYGIRYFYIPYDDVFEIIFKNNALFTPRDLELNIDIIKALIITSPEYGDTFLSGYNYITWTSSGNINYVIIDLYKDGSFLETIVSGTSNDGSYNWYIYSDEYIDGSYYQIKIRDYYDSSIYDYSDYFTINCEVDSTITIISPKTNDIFSNGYNCIDWSTTGDIDYVRIELWEYNGTHWSMDVIISYTYNDGSYNWYLDSDDIFNDNIFLIKIIDYDDNSIYDLSDYFTIEIDEDYVDPYNTEPDNFFLEWLIFIILPAIAIIISVAIILIRRHKRKSLGEPI